MRPFAIVSITNTILAISAAVVLGISAYVEHTVCLLSALSGSWLIIDRESRYSQLYLYLRCFRRRFHHSCPPRGRTRQIHQAKSSIAKD